MNKPRVTIEMNGIKHSLEMESQSEVITWKEIVESCIKLTKTHTSGAVAEVDIVDHLIKVFGIKAETAQVVHDQIQKSQESASNSKKPSGQKSSGSRADKTPKRRRKSNQKAQAPS